MERGISRILALVCAVCVLTASLAGCQSAVPAATTPAAQQSAAAEQTSAPTTAPTVAPTAEPTAAPTPYEFSIFRSTWTELNEDTDLVIQTLNKKLNIKIKILTSPYETWIEKYNVLMSSDQTPDLSVVSGPNYNGYNNWANQGKYVDLTDRYSKYPNIVAKVPQSSFDAIKLDGKVYCIPKPYLYEDALVLRVDWLKKLGLEMPKTLDELYTVLKAFTDKDPDGNGKADTCGFLTDDSTYNFMYFYGAFGAYGSPVNGYQWMRGDDGKMMSTMLTPGNKEATKYLAKLYSEKIIDPEWMITKSQGVIDKFKAGKGGCVNTTISQMYVLESDMQKVDPAVQLDATMIPGPDGKFRKDIMLSYYMTCSISAKAAQPDTILGFLDYLLSDEGITLLNYGVEGVTYTKDNGKIVVNEDAAKANGLVGGHKFTWMMAPAVWTFPNDDRGNKYRDMCKWFLDQQPALPIPELPSQKDVTTKQGADMIQKALTEMIIGKSNVDTDWDKMIQKWSETGGEQLTKEVNDIIK